MIPVGVYMATFEGVEEVTNPKYEGPRLKFTFPVASGPLAGRRLTALTDVNVTTTNHAGVIIAGLIGRQLVDGDTPEELIEAAKGKVFVVGYRAGTKGGKPAVRSVDAVPQGM